MNLENPRTRRLLIALSIVSLVILLAAGGTLWYLTRTPARPTPPVAGGSPPPAILTPPASLDELAARYPQIAALLQDPSLASAYKDFMLAYQQGGIQAAEDMARERGLLDKKRNVRITLVVDSPENAPAVAAELEKFGIVIEGTYRELIDIAVPMPLIEQFAKTDDPGKLFAQLGGMKHIIKLRMPMPNRVQQGAQSTEGVSTTGAAAWHQAGFTGKGVKIGVLDLGFDGYKNLLGKTLPDAERVTVKSFTRGQEADQTGEVHGAACAEIIHAMAPDAELYLAQYNGSDTGMGRGVEWLVSQGVHIISHSANGLVGPMDGTGWSAQVVDEVAAKGILWVNSSGNYATEHYRFTFNDQKGDGKHVFPDGSQALLYNPPSEDARIILNWNDWGRDAKEDYDLYLYDANGKLVVASEESQQGQLGDRPVEGFRLDKPKQKSYYIVIVAKRITRPAVFNLFALDGRLGQYTVEYSLGTPGDARGSLTVGAIAWRNSKLESFSSQGPTADNRLKPEITAPDGVTTQSYRPRVFNGTSASTPHVAGAAALVLSRFPNLKAPEVMAFLTSSVVDMGPSGPDAAYGHGRLQLPPPDKAPPQPGKPQPPVVVTAQPVPVQPEPGKEPGAAAAVSVLACLSVLVCGGSCGSLGGLMLLVFLARPKPRPVPMIGPTPGVSLGPAIQPSLRPQPPAPPPMAAPALVGASGQRITLRMGKSFVGRAPENEIHLDDPQISRRHAEITWDGVRCAVTDLSSRNGTFVNGKRLTPNWPETLRPGDRVSFGTASVWTVAAG